MAYKINGLRMTSTQAALVLADIIYASRLVWTVGEARSIAENLLYSISPGVRREYARFTIACYYVD